MNSHITSRLKHASITLICHIAPKDFFRKLTQVRNGPTHARSDATTEYHTLTIMMIYALAAPTMHSFVAQPQYLSEATLEKSTLRSAHGADESTWDTHTL